MQVEHCQAANIFAAKIKKTTTFWDFIEIVGMKVLRMKTKAGLHRGDSKCSGFHIVAFSLLRRSPQYEKQKMLLVSSSFSPVNKNNLHDKR